MRMILANLKKPARETRLADKLLPWLQQSYPATTSFFLFGNDIQTGPQPDYSERDFQYFDLFKQGSAFNNCVKFYAKLVEIRPDVVVSPSPELILTALLYRQTHPCVVIWDVQENHYLNFQYQEVYSGWKKWLGLFSSGFGTTYLAQASDRLILAERIYLRQFPFVASDSLVLENKAPVNWTFGDVSFSSDRSILFSGFITKESGVFRALDWWSQNKLHRKSWTLVIAGYCPSESLRNEIAKKAEQIPGVRVEKLDRWFSDLEILEFLQKSFAIFAPYRISKANIGKIPTKFWEAAFIGRWILCEDSSPFAGLKSEGFPIYSFDPTGESALDFLETWYSEKRLPDPQESKGFRTYLKLPLSL